MNSKDIFKYSQPEFYHFSEDSTFLAREVSEYFSSDKRKALNGIDLCAGCGVIGIELVKKSTIFKRFDFCELQKEFIPHLKINLDKVAAENSAELNVFHMPFQEISNFNQYDLVVCNPPYFDPLAGRLPESRERRKCRFMEKYDWEQFIVLIEKLLTTEGVAFFLQRLDLFEQSMIFDRVELYKSFGDIGLFRMFRLHKN